MLLLMKLEVDPGRRPHGTHGVSVATSLCFLSAGKYVINFGQMCTCGWSANSIVTFCKMLLLICSTFCSDRESDGITNRTFRWIECWMSKVHTKSITTASPLIQLILSSKLRSRCPVVPVVVASNCASMISLQKQNGGSVRSEGFHSCFSKKEKEKKKCWSYLCKTSAVHSRWVSTCCQLKQKTKRQFTFHLIHKKWTRQSRVGSSCVTSVTYNLGDSKHVLISILCLTNQLLHENKKSKKQNLLCIPKKRNHCFSQRERFHSVAAHTPWKGTPHHLSPGDTSSLNRQAHHCHKTRPFGNQNDKFWYDRRFFGTWNFQRNCFVWNYHKLILKKSGEDSPGGTQNAKNLDLLVMVSQKKVIFVVIYMSCSTFQCWRDVSYVVFSLGGMIFCVFNATLLRNFFHVQT